MVGHGQGGLVLAEHEAGVGDEDEPVELERESVGVFVGRDLASLDGGHDELADQSGESDLEGGDALLDRPRPALPMLCFPAVLFSGAILPVHLMASGRRAQHGDPVAMGVRSDRP